MSLWNHRIIKSSAGLFIWFKETHWSDVQDAVEIWMEGEDPAIFPAPSSLEDIQASPDAKGRVLVLVDVNTSFLENVTERVNITIPRHALAAIDRMAKAHGLSRSAYMARAALSFQA